jgi:hypothetical protein
MGAVRRFTTQAATLAARVVMAASAAAAMAVLPAGLTASAAGRAAAAPSRAGRLQVGTITLRRCAAKPLTFCGGLAVPLDYSSADSPRIHLGFRWLPATGHATGTILAVEGGPGYASTGSEPQYLAMTGRLLTTRNLLLIDLRGTGRPPQNVSGFVAHRRRVIVPTCSLPTRLGAAATRAAADAGRPAGSTAIAAAALAAIATRPASVAAWVVKRRTAPIW